MIIDEEVAVVGSSNMDFRSFELISELSLLCYDKKFAARLKKVGDGYVSKSKKVTINVWNKRSHTQRMIDNLARLTSSLQ